MILKTGRITIDPAGKVEINDFEFDLCTSPRAAAFEIVEWAEEQLRLHARALNFSPVAAQTDTEGATSHQ